ncbi:hypothetical protein [Yersinia ruckeri]|uniref:hypothetical protein n=1 Tax=Yersinia ruckeri TaxID=29486 RepID=UPI0020C04FD2|nr:hypothetical protein [Yersinia ruckeri]EKN4689599.1 hypothetical protein [Yersinia ruckeri]MCK8586379.1 hypothetical protein [Yersinia ruckeri]MCW6615623.1 hypothetical protein [Yersinia ruckeri]
MITSNESLFEEKYKDFLKVRRAWLQLVFQHAVYTDKNIQGEDCRPVAILTDKQILNKAERLLQEWQQFADLAESKRSSGISSAPSPLYLPVPAILKGARRFTIGSFDATTTKNYYREEILRKIDKRLSMLLKAPTKDTYTITDLEMDKKVIGGYPEGTRFRHRITGYRDTMLDMSFSTEPNKYSVDERYRVGTHGVIVDGNSMDAPNAYQINNGEKMIYSSHYAMISPVRCSLFAGGSLYLISDIEHAKKLRTEISRKNCNESAKAASRRKTAERAAQRAQEKATKPARKTSKKGK